MEFFTITDPSDWPSSMPELNTIDTLLRCGICYEFFDIAMILPKCSHNYCSICIRRHMNYKNQCPTCNTPAEVSQLCNNRALDELVSNFKAVRPLILKLCKEEAKKSDKVILQSPSSEPAGGKKKTTKETILSPPREQYGGKKTKKTSPFFKETNHDSDGDFTVESKGLASAETPRSKAQRRSNYQNTRDKIASHASELASSSAASPTRTASSSEEDPLMEPDASKGALSSSLNKSNEENIDPTYQIPADGDHSDEDVFAPVVTPSKPSTSRGQADGGLPGEKNLTPLTRSEKVDCPVCGVPISTKHINVHLDSCLTKIEEKEAKRRIPKRKPLPKIVSSLLSDKEMRKKLREHGLSPQGNRQILNKRLLEFTLVYNAQCDSINPMSVESIVKDFNKTDKLKGQPNPVHVEQRLKVKRSLPEDEIAKAQEEYLKSHGSQFSDLIKNMRERACNSKKAGKVEEVDKEHSGPTLPSVLNNIPPVPKDDAMPGSVTLINGDETSGKDTVCDGVTRSPPDPKKQLSAVTEDVKSVQNHGGPSAQPENANSCDALPLDNDMPTEVYDVARKQDGGKGSRLKLKKSKYFEDSTKGTGSADSRVLSQEDEASVKKILDEGREECQMEEGIVMATKMAENSEELMDMMEDEVSPVFGQCSIGSSSSSSRKAQSGSSTKKADGDGIDTTTLEDQEKVVPPSSVPPLPNTLLLNDFDTISEGSSLVTLESFSETGSHGDVPSPGDVNCIPESPEAEKGKRSKRIGRRKRKPEVNPEDDGIEAGKETRLTRSRKRGKTSAD
ncbi:E3 ubiquitin-protein ligase RAD18 [Strongylocentrotus purpuratus]|uniref:RING-type E3 ubiquitin transferase n=1 Tax=Strongylocentrotus purpuratus TaxID=7668 RepID=A0A7M7HGA9_STRPU|nr:E3 ubiquitin-protein ligase RAD18 [Strongylocentrotus purpuratus]